MADLIISIGRMPFLPPTIDNADPLFALVIIPGFSLYQVQVKQDPGSGTLFLSKQCYYYDKILI